uniref:BOS complex subunit NCLN n=1 Tax=Sinocyclocheilus anshuiensis TaxID=1608454 RepID=A0A671M577_9TELE
MTLQTWKVAALLLLSVHLLHASALPAASSYEFIAYRMQQYNLHQDKHAICETHHWKISFLDLIKNALLYGGRISGPAEGDPHVQYVVPEDDQLLCMNEEVTQAAATKSASALVRGERDATDSLYIITATAFQILVNNNSPFKPITDTTIITSEGVLPGAGEDPPTIVIMVHYDSFGLAPWLAYGADSNGSGITVLLELVRLFHHLYSDSRSQAPLVLSVFNKLKCLYHLLFSLTGGGKYNFLGTKRWLEENMDQAESSLLHDNVAFVLCLDSLGTGDEIFLHVLQPLKPGTPQYSFIQQLEQIISARFPWVRFGTVHKKINLQETTVASQHERYGMKRIPGFTLSHIENPKSEQRGSILDTMAQVDIRKLKRNAVVVAESLARFMYNLSDKGSAKDMQVFKGSLDIQDSRLSALMTMITSVPRAVQLMDREPEHKLLHTFHPDRRYAHTDTAKMVKPAAFDLFLGGCIAGYLGVVYYAIQNFCNVYTKLKATVKAKHQ